MRAIDLNADLGETVDGMPTADDEAMFAVVSSASVACGGHAGDERSMRESVRHAMRHDVAVGAHPSYPDRAGFGRAVVAIESPTLQESVSAQLAALAAAGADIRYVKPHGALYHVAGERPEVADAVARAVAALSERLGRAIPVLGLGAALAEAAHAAGLPFVREAFLDRGYTASGGLVHRSRPGALLERPEAVADRAVRLALSGEVEAVDGSVVAVDAVSFCVHGDTPAAVAMARAVRAALAEAGVSIRSPW